MASSALTTAALIICEFAALMAVLAGVRWIVQARRRSVKASPTGSFRRLLWVAKALLAGFAVVVGLILAIFYIPTVTLLLF